MIEKDQIVLGNGDVGMAVTSFGKKDNENYIFKGAGVSFHDIEPREIGSEDKAKLNETEIQYAILSTSSKSLQVLIEQLQEAKQRLIDNSQ